MRYIIFLLSMLVLWVPHAHSAGIVINAFNRGELSPLLRGRTDVRMYYSGCETLENMLVMPYGGVRKRPGSYYIAPAKNADKVCRLIPFSHSVTDNYIIEAGHLYMRFYRNGGQVQDPDGTEDMTDVGGVDISGNVIAQWKFNDDAANTIVADTAGTHNGTATAHTDGLSTTGITDTCLDLEGLYTIGVEDHEDFTFSNMGDTAFSLAVWAYVVPSASAQNIITKKDDTTGSVANEWAFVLYPGKQLHLRLYDNSNSAYVSKMATDSISEGWHHLVTTYDGRGGASAYLGIKLYIDRDVITTFTLRSEANYSQMRDTDADVIIGAFENYLGNRINFWKDKLDNIVIFDKELTVTEVEGLFDTAGPYEITTTYTEDELFRLQYIQSADVMYIVHPDHAPRQLTRAGHDDWTIADVSFTEGPFKAENTTTITITPSAATGDITLTASAALFEAGHVGSYWQISHYISAAEIAGSLTDNGDSSSLTVYKGQSYDYHTDNTWVGKATLQRSYDEESTWFDVIPFTSSTDENTTYADEEDLADAVYRVHYVDTSGTFEYSVMAHSFKREGIVEITAYTDSVTVTATVTKTLGATGATKYWSESAWSDDEGYPSCIASCEERQVYANTAGSPQTVWFSETDNWDSFLEGAESSDAISRTIAANQVNAIQWLSPQTVLMFGTTGGEWKLYASGADEPLTPDNLNVKRQTGYGSACIQAQVMNNSTIFVQRQGEIIRKLQYSFDVDMWTALDLTILAEHITGNGITQIALQKTPYPILWCVREDGELIGLTMEESQEVLGWHHHNFSGNVESVAVISGDAEDELWIVVERTVDNNIVKYIEQIQPINWGIEQKAFFFIDSGLSFDGGNAVAITNISKANPAVVTAMSHGLTDGSQIRITDSSGMVELNDNVYTVGTIVNVDSFQLRDAADAVNIDSTGFTAYTGGGEAIWVENRFGTFAHLEGETVSIIGDGGYYGQETIMSGTITLDDYYNKVHGGLPYTAKIKPMTLSMPTAPDALFGINQRITEVLLRLHETLDCEVGANWTMMDPYAFREVDALLETATPLYTGDKILSFPGSYERAGNICIQSAKPLPLTVLGLRAEFEAFP